MAISWLAWFLHGLLQAGLARQFVWNDESCCKEDPVATMANDIQDTINNVIKLCRNGEQSFAAAARVFDRDELKNELLCHSRERARFAAALSNAMAQRGYAGQSLDSNSPGIHGGWINLTDVRPEDNQDAVLAACERGEDSAAEAYAQAMMAQLPGRVADLVSIQYPIVKATHDRIRRLRGTADNSLSFARNATSNLATADVLFQGQQA
jgi:uncharacterized protein (TIGR02284 family)